ncbi:phosphoenolpyruvate--protein phosphotransferase [Mediannikoviicoccus vaginalis]|uniref:phosphoenolpyruvate--protein phosphotransferase n=1 Tax=Mediannikoviicoccus vaginalis TaxID=2899727 RepID=UPI001F00342D|nr:phosphoenolpyruvate--protein phosphotransferase [Mediannikoviicoccus vaginalis]
MANTLKGIVASEGVVLGRAYLFIKDKLEVSNKKIDENEIPEEKNKFTDALDDYREYLSNLETDTDAQRNVVEAHIGMLDDPYLIDTVNGKIDVGENVESALVNSISEMVSTIEGLDDPYLKERAVDYKDIGERLLHILKGVKPQKLFPLPKDSIIVAQELTPTDTSVMDRDNVIGFCMDLGGKTAHTSIIAQTLGIPALVGMKNVTKVVKDGDLIIIDDYKGQLIVNPDEKTVEEYKKLIQEQKEEKERLEKYKNEDSITPDGKKVEVAVNIGNIEDLEDGIEKGASSVGLFRTEFLYMGNTHFPTEEEQFKVYKRAAELLKGNTLVIRTLDIGGDKSLSYFEFPQEDNPFLGWRALRICFDMCDVFETQLRAILRASKHGNVKILLPMVISVDEIIKFNEILEKVKSDLRKRQEEFNEDIEVGIMVETPASSIIADDLIKYVDFFSIGTNDLTQYVLAVDRGNEKISNLYSTYNKAVLRMIKRVIDISHEHGKWTGMCGGFAGDEKATKMLLGMGLDEFSVPGPKVAKIKDIIRNTSLKEAEEFSNEIISLTTTEEIEKRIKKETQR